MLKEMLEAAGMNRNIFETVLNINYCEKCILLEQSRLPPPTLAVACFSKASVRGPPAWVLDVNLISK